MWRRFIAVAAFVASACSGASTTADTTASTGREVAVPVPVATSEVRSASTTHDQVLDAVEGFGRSTLTVNDPPNAGHPDLARFRTGEVLANARTAVLRNQQLGIAYRLPRDADYTHTATIVQATDVRAVVHDCVVDRAQQVALADGRVLNDAIATKLFETTLVVSEGVWKVSENALVERWEGVGGCAVSGSR
jgi:hypothetical protein